jgi:hypothetical protein
VVWVVVVVGGGAEALAEVIVAVEVLVTIPKQFQTLFFSKFHYKLYFH